jgi:hypothetical protein
MAACEIARFNRDRIREAGNGNMRMSGMGERSTLNFQHPTFNQAEHCNR